MFGDTLEGIPVRAKDLPSLRKLFSLVGLSITTSDQSTASGLVAPQ
jgi:hypothetical protein